MRPWVFRCLVLIAACLVANVASSQAQVQLPIAPNAWLNSPPISNEMLAGKAAVIYFFEEG